MNKGESPSLLMDVERADEWYGRNPFEELKVAGTSDNLVIGAEGTTDGHNLITDSMFTDAMFIDHWTPVSPLFVKDLAGRAIYIGFGPERKANAEWGAYQIDENVPEDEKNPFIPLVVFPRYCRSAERMEGAELFEQVFLTKFRCLEMSMGFNGMLSGASEDDELVAATYLGANLYPYKLRLDTFYVDGFKLPQTQMVYARGDAEGVDAHSAKVIGDRFLAAWQQREAGTSYADWLEALGTEELERMYQSGCTVIPTFEACNGYHVVDRDFGLEDYWPGRAVIGLHDVVERVGNQAPQGTILDVVEPGFITATKVRPAKVIVSDGSGYVSPNAVDPEPLMPNHFLPHTRTIDNWRATWIPTHPEHFEAPAIWGWDLNMGRFMQLSGPIWDPLHYYYESVDAVLEAFDKHSVSSDNPLVPVPHEMEHRFFPVIPIKGFDTFSEKAFHDRIARKVSLLCSLKRVITDDFTAGIGYHPLPAEFEFELDPFWFPEMHPLNRGIEAAPDDVRDMLVPIINPTITISAFIPTVDAPEDVLWLTDESRLFTPVGDPMLNYPFLVRYLVSDLDIHTIARLCPTPFLTDPGEKIKYPAPGWWLDSKGNQLDGPLALQELIPNIHDALWDMRQEGVNIVQFRHMVYRTNLPLYIMAWWNSWNVKQLEMAMENWIKDPVPLEVELPAGME